MRDRSTDLERLAKLLVGFGANLQPGQVVLGVTAYLGMEDAARAVARAGYKHGAKWVDVFWWDDLIKRERLLHADPDTLSFAPSNSLLLGGCQAVLPTATEWSRSRISAALSPRSSSRGSAAALSSPKTRSKSGVVR